MALLTEIQVDLLNDKVGVGQILRKLLVLASKKNLNILEEWVLHETDGYPENIPVPSYRTAPITYTGSFSYGTTNWQYLPIPTAFIKKFAGEEWLWHDFREGLPEIDRRVINSNGKGTFSIDTSNLQFPLQGMLLEGVEIIDIKSRIDIGSMVRIQETVSTKTLNLVLKLEKEVPALAEITIDNKNTITNSDQKKANQMTNYVIFNDVKNVNIGSLSQVTQNVIKGDKQSLVHALNEIGISPEKALELANLAEQEKPQDNSKKLGNKILKWFKHNLNIAASEELR